MAIERARTGGTDVPEISIARLQQAVAADEGLIGYFFLAPQVFIIFRVDRESFEAERVICNSDQIDCVNELLEAIETLDSTGPIVLDPYIATAGEILITPATRKFIESKGRVIISPHHQLHLFPFHAASWDGRILIERCPVRYIPNFSSLLVEWRGNENAGAFAIGVSHFDMPAQKWPDLPNTEQQASEIGSIYRAAGRNAEVLTGNEASVAAFRTRMSNEGLKDCSVLHLATHGTSVFSPDTQDEPMESKLVLADGTIDGIEIGLLRLPARVAVLSACNSGQRAIRGRGMNELPGDDIFGLQAALFQAGVHTVLGSLWPVETNAAYAVTSAFHRNYSQGDTPEAALQKALIGLCRADNAAGAFAWAPFFLSSLGNVGSRKVVD
jgi:CHAT domain-containing protein